MLPILHLNGYKIANPTVLARIPRKSCVSLFEGYGYRPLVSSRATTRDRVHQALAAALDEALDEIAAIQPPRATAARPSARAGR